MAVEAGHIQVTEYSKETIPYLNWMMEDLFCRYGVSIPYFLLDFEFPDYSQHPDWVSGYNSNLDWGDWGYQLYWFNELLGLLFDAAGLPRWQMPDWSPMSFAMLNDWTTAMYEAYETEVEITPESGNNRIHREGFDYLNYVDAITDYEDDPEYTISERTASQSSVTIWKATGGYGSKRVEGAQIYYKYDTRTISSVASAKFVIKVDNVSLIYTAENPVMYIYKYNFGTLGSEDWTGGTKIAEREFTTADNDQDIEIALTPSDVTVKGYSRYRFTLEKIANNDFWPEPTTYYSHSIHLQSLVNSITLAIIRGAAEEEESEFSPLGGTDIRCVRRASGSTTYDNAKTLYEDDPGYCASYLISNYDVFTSWSIFHGEPGSSKEYQISVHQGYTKFDTTNISSVKTAKFVLAVNTVGLTNVTTNPILYIYKHDFGDTLECASWSGGTLLTSSREFTTADNGKEVEIEINSDDVVTGDYSRYRFTLEKIDEVDYWPEPDPNVQKRHYIRCDTIKLVLT